MHFRSLNQRRFKIGEDVLIDGETVRDETLRRVEGGRRVEAGDANEGEKFGTWSERERS